MAKRLPPHDPREWLNRAASSLERARNAAPGIYREDLCFDAQQAAEKAVKAVFIHRGERFPYVHDLDDLLQLLEDNGLKVPKYVREARRLSRYAVETRYPGMAMPVTQAKYRTALRIAEAIVRWAERQIAKP
jgi:HEPN domain-containing protein